MYVSTCVCGVHVYMCVFQWMGYEVVSNLCCNSFFIHGLFSSKYLLSFLTREREGGREITREVGGPGIRSYVTSVIHMKDGQGVKTKRGQAKGQRLSERCHSQWV